jgi:uncharacterized protein involved in exopolysaccharide biosynthesis
MEPLPTASNPASGATEPGDTIDLRGYLQAAWRARRWIGLAAVAAAFAAGGLGLLAPRAYEASVTLAVSVSKLGDDRLQQTMSPASVKPVIQSRAVARSLIREFGLDKPPASLTPSTFVSTALSVEEIRNTNLLVVKVRLPDPGQAAEVATRLAARASAVVQQTIDNEATRARDMIGLQLDAGRKRYEEATTALKNYRDTAQIEALRKDVEAVLVQRGNLLDLLVSIESEKAKLKTAGEQLAARQKIDSLKKTIDSDPAMLEATRPQSAMGQGVLSLQMRNEVVNPVYEKLDQIVAESRITIAEREKTRNELVGQRHVDAAKVAKLTELYAKEAQIDRLVVDRDITQRLFVEMSTRYEQARLQVAGRSAQLEVVDPAEPPDQPLSQNVVTRTLIGLLLGFVLSTAAAFLLHAVRSAARQ